MALGKKNRATLAPTTSPVQHLPFEKLRDPLHLINFMKFIVMCGKLREVKFEQASCIPFKGLPSIGCRPEDMQQTYSPIVKQQLQKFDNDIRDMKRQANMLCHPILGVDGTSRVMEMYETIYLNKTKFTLDISNSIPIISSDDDAEEVEHASTSKSNMFAHPTPPASGCDEFNTFQPRSDRPFVEESSPQRSKGWGHSDSWVSSCNVSPTSNTTSRTVGDWGEPMTTLPVTPQTGGSGFNDTTSSSNNKLESRPFDRQRSESTSSHRNNTPHFKGWGHSDSLATSCNVSPTSNTTSRTVGDWGEPTTTLPVTPQTGGSGLKGTSSSPNKKLESRPFARQRSESTSSHTNNTPHFKEPISQRSKGWGHSDSWVSSCNVSATSNTTSRTVGDWGEPTTTLRVTPQTGGSGYNDTSSSSNNKLESRPFDQQRSESTSSHTNNTPHFKEPISPAVSRTENTGWGSANNVWGPPLKSNKSAIESKQATATVPLPASKSWSSPLKTNQSGSGNNQNFTIMAVPRPLAIKSASPQKPVESESENDQDPTIKAIPLPLVKESASSHQPVESTSGNDQGTVGTAWSSLNNVWGSPLKTNESKQVAVPRQATMSRSSPLKTHGLTSAKKPVSVSRRSNRESSPANEESTSTNRRPQVNTPSPRRDIDTASRTKEPTTQMENESSLVEDGIASLGLSQPIPTTVASAVVDNQSSSAEDVSFLLGLSPKKQVSFSAQSHDRRGSSSHSATTTPSKRNNSVCDRKSRRDSTNESLSRHEQNRRSRCEEDQDDDERLTHSRRRKEDESEDRRRRSSMYDDTPPRRHRDDDHYNPSRRRSSRRDDFDSMQEGDSPPREVTHSSPKRRHVQEEEDDEMMHDSPAPTTRRHLQYDEIDNRSPKRKYDYYDESPSRRRGSSSSSRRNDTSSSRHQNRNRDRDDMDTRDEGERRSSRTETSSSSRHRRNRSRGSDSDIDMREEGECTSSSSINMEQDQSSSTSTKHARSDESRDGYKKSCNYTKAW